MCILGGDFKLTRGKRRIVDARNDRRRQMLETFKAMQWTVRLHAEALDRGVELAQSPRDADKRTRGPQAGDKMRYLPTRLPPDFGGRGLIVGLPVCIVVVLIGVKIAPRAVL